MKKLHTHKVAQIVKNFKLITNYQKYIYVIKKFVSKIVLYLLETLPNKQDNKIIEIPRQQL
jgi:hypothetical protein